MGCSFPFIRFGFSTRLFPAFVGLAAALASPNAADAQDIWGQATTGAYVWDNAANWSSGIPGSSSTASFATITAGNTVTITLSTTPGMDVANIVNVTSTTTGSWVWATGTLTLGGTSAGFNYSGAGSSTFSGSLAGTGALNVTAGTLTMSGTNTYSGLTTVNGGTLTLGATVDDSALNGGFTLTSGTLNINSATALGTGPLTITAGTIGNSSGAAVVLTPTQPSSISLNGAAFTWSGNNNLNLGTGNVTVSGASTTITVSSSGALTFGGTVTGGKALTIGGTGTGGVVFSGTSAFGAVSLSNTGLATATGLATIGTPTLTLGSSTIAGAFTQTGGTMTLTIDKFSMPFTVAGGGLTINGAVVVNGPATGTALNIGSGANATGSTWLNLANGASLTVNPALTTGLTVNIQNAVANAGNNVNGTLIIGQGNSALQINAPSGTITIGETDSTTGTSRSGVIMVLGSGGALTGGNVINAGGGTLTLGTTGSAGSDGSQNNGNSFSSPIIDLGSGSNAIYATTFNLGLVKTGGYVFLNSTLPTQSSATSGATYAVSLPISTTTTLTMSQTSAGGAMNLLIGQQNVATSSMSIGVLDTTGGILKGTFGTVTLGTSTASQTQSKGAGAVGSWVLGVENNSVTLNTLLLTNAAQATVTSTGIQNAGIFSLNGGTVTFNNATAGSTGILYGPLLTAGKTTLLQTVNSVINLNGGTLNLNNQNIGSATAPINFVNMLGGTLQDVDVLNAGLGTSPTGFTQTSGTLLRDNTGTTTIGGAYTVNGGAIVQLNAGASGTASIATPSLSRLSTGSYGIATTGTGAGYGLLASGSIAGTLNIVPVTGNLDSGGSQNELLTITTNPGLTNGILAPWTVAQTSSAANASADFTTYDSTSTSIARFGAAALIANGSYVTYASGGGINSATNTDVGLVSSANGVQNLTASVTPYALKVQNTIGDSGTNSLTIVSGGLILDGGSIAANGGLFFGTSGTSEALIFTTNQGGTISSAITATSMTTFGPGTLTLNSASGTITHTVGTVNINSGTLKLVSTTSPSVTSVVINASGPVNINNSGTLTGIGTINVTGTGNGVSFGPNATFAPGNGASFGTMIFTTASGNVSSQVQVTNPGSLTVTSRGAIAPTSTNLGFGLGISPTNVVGSTISLFVGTPVGGSGAAANSGTSNANTVGNLASGFTFSSTSGIFSLSPITNVSVTDNNASADFTGGAYSYLIGTVPAGSTAVTLSNAGNFTFPGFVFDQPTAQSLTVTGGKVFLNLTVPAPTPFVWSGASSASWTTPGNWSTGVVPVSGNTAIFSIAGNGNTTIGLGGAAQPVGGIKFDTTAAAAYILGSAVGNGDGFLFDAGAAVTVTGTVTTAQTLNAAIKTNGTGALTVSNSGTGGLTFNGTLSANGTPGLLTFNGSGATTFAGAINAGSISGLVMSGTGSLTLSGANAFSTVVTLNSGTLNINNNSALGTGALTINGGAIATSAAGTVTFTNPIASGSQTVTVTGTGSGGLVLPGTYAFSALTVNAANGTATSTGTTNSNATVGNASLTLVNGLTMSGALTLGGGSMTVANDYLYPFSVTGGGLIINGAVTATGFTMGAPSLISSSSLIIANNASLTVNAAGNTVNLQNDAASATPTAIGSIIIGQGNAALAINAATINIGQTESVGATAANRNNVFMLLGSGNNVFNASSTINLGVTGGAGANGSLVATAPFNLPIIDLGSGGNTISAATFNLGGFKTGGYVFLASVLPTQTTTGTLGVVTYAPSVIANSATTLNLTVTALNIGQNTAATANASIGVLDTTGGVLNAALGTVTLGQNAFNGAGGAAGSWVLGTGNNIVTLNTLNLTNSGAVAQTQGIGAGVFSLNGGTVTFNTATAGSTGILYGGATPTKSAVAVQFANSIVNLNGGTLNLNNQNIGTSGVPIDFVNMLGGTLQDVNSLNVGTGATPTGFTQTGGMLLRDNTGTTTIAASYTIAGGAIVQLNAGTSGTGIATVTTPSLTRGAGATGGSYAVALATSGQTNAGYGVLATGSLAGTLDIIPVQSALDAALGGSQELFTISGGIGSLAAGNSLNANLLQPWIVARSNGTLTASANFTQFDATSSGIQALPLGSYVTYASGGGINSATATDVGLVSSANGVQTLTSAVTVFGLKVQNSITDSGTNSLTINGNSGMAGLILDGGSIAANGGLVFGSAGSAEALIYITPQGGTIAAPITASALTTFGPGTLTLNSSSGTTTHTINGAVNVNSGVLNLVNTATTGVVINTSGPVNINNSGTLTGTGTINVSGGNGVSFGPNATFAPGKGASYGVFTITTAGGGVSTQTQMTNPINLTTGSAGLVATAPTNAGLGFGLGISPTNVIGSNIVLYFGTPASNSAAVNSGASSTQSAGNPVLGSNASGFAISGGLFTLDPSTQVTVIDNNSIADFPGGGSLSYLVGTAPAGSSGTVTNLANFTPVGGFALTGASLQVSGTGVYLNLNVAAFSPYVWLGGTSNVWTTGSNWSGGSAPVSGSTAVFTSVGSTAPISLGGTAQPINTISYFGAAKAFTLGTAVGNGDALKFDADGGVIVVSTVANPEVINAAIQTLGAVTITNNGMGGITFNGTLTLAGGTAGLLTFTGINAASVTTYNGPISTGANGLLQSGAGTTVLGGNNSYTGLTQVSAGALTLGGNNTLVLGGVSVSGTGALNINNVHGLGTGALTVAGGSINNNVAGTVWPSVSWGGAFSFGGAQTFNFGAASVTQTADVVATSTSAAGMSFGAYVTNSNSFTLAGSGTGGVAFNVASLTFNNLAVSSAGSLTTSGTQLTVNNNLTASGASTMTINAAQVTVAGTVTVGGAATMTMNAPLTAGAVTVNSSAGTATAFTGTSVTIGTPSMTLGSATINGPLSVLGGTAAFTDKFLDQFTITGGGLSITGAVTATGLNTGAVTPPATSSAWLSIANGASLTINAGAGAVNIQNNTNTTGAFLEATVIVGQGNAALQINTPGGTMIIGENGGSTGTARSNVVMLLGSGNNVFNATGGTITLGTSSNGPGADGSGAIGNNFGVPIIQLGSGNNTINATTFNLGLFKTGGYVFLTQQIPNQTTSGTTFAPSVPTTGANLMMNVTNLIMGQQTGASNSSSIGVLDTTGGALIGTFGTVTLGQSVAQTGTLGGGAAGSWVLGVANNSVTLNTLNLTNQSAAQGALAGIITAGIFSLNGGTVTFNAAGTGIVYGGTIAKSTSTNSIVNLNGGILNLNNHNIGSATAPINYVNMLGGVLQNVGVLNAGTGLTAPTGFTQTSGTLLRDNTGATTIAAAYTIDGGAIVQLNAGASGTAIVTTPSLNRLTTGSYVPDTTAGVGAMATGTLAGTLDIVPVTGNLDGSGAAKELFAISGGVGSAPTAGNSLNANLLQPWIIARANGTASASANFTQFDTTSVGIQALPLGGYVTYAPGGAGDINLATANDVGLVSSANGVQTLSSSVTVFGLKVQNSINDGGTNSLTIAGNGSMGGLILDGGSITANGGLLFGPSGTGEALIYTTPQGGAITAPMTASALTTFGPGTLTLNSTPASGGGSGITTHTINGTINVNGGALNLVRTVSASVVINASGPVNINNGATLMGSGIINVTGSNGVSFGPNATFAPGNGAGFGIFNITTGSGNVATATQLINPASYISGAQTITAPSASGLGYGLGISPTNVVGSNITLYVGTPVATGGSNTGLSNSSTLGSRAGGFLISSSGGGLFTLDPITTVNVIDANGLSDFPSGGSFSYLVGTVPSGSSGVVTNFPNFTATGLTLASASLQISSTNVYLNLTVTTPPQFVWLGNTSNWATGSNWTGGATPVSGNTALFTLYGQNTTVGLGNAVQAINTISFVAGAQAYTLGTAVGNGDAFRFDAGGGVTVASGVANLQTINAAVQTLGALTIANSGAGGLTFNGALTLAGGGTAELLTFTGTSASSVTTYAGNISTGISGLTQAGLGTVILSGNNSYNGPTQTAAGVLTLSGNNSALSGAITATGGTLNINSTAVLGNVALAASGSGTLNIFTTTVGNGGVTVSGNGTVNINSSSALGTGAFVVSGGTIGNSTAGPIALTTNPSSISLNGNFSFASNQNLNLGNDNITLTTGVTLTMSGAGNLTFGGNVGGGQALTVAAGGSGGLILNGNATLGTLTIGGGAVNHPGQFLYPFTVTGGALTITDAVTATGFVMGAPNQISSAQLTIANNASLTVNAAGKVVSIEDDTGSATAVALGGILVGQGDAALSINAATINISGGNGGGGSATSYTIVQMLLGSGNNVFNATSSFTFGNSANVGQDGSTFHGNTFAVPILDLGSGSNTISTPTFNLGSQKTGGYVFLATPLPIQSTTAAPVYAPSVPVSAATTLTLNVPTLIVGQLTAATSGTTTIAVLDTTGGTLNATLGTVTLGLNNFSVITGAIGSWVLGVANNNVTLNTLNLTSSNIVQTQGFTSGVFSLNGGLVSINTGGTGILYGGNAGASPQFANSVVNLNGGTLNMNQLPIGSPTAPINFVNMTGGTLQNASSLNVGFGAAPAGFIQTGGTILVDTASQAGNTMTTTVTTQYTIAGGAIVQLNAGTSGRGIVTLTTPTLLRSTAGSYSPDATGGIGALASGALAGTLDIIPVHGALDAASGSQELFVISGGIGSLSAGNSVNANLLQPWIIARTNGTTTASANFTQFDTASSGIQALPVGSYVTYAASGGINSATANDVGLVSSANGVQTLAASVTVFGLKAQNTINDSGTNSLTVAGNGSMGGLILDGGSIAANGGLFFGSAGAGEALIYATPQGGTITSPITASALTTFGPGTLTLSSTSAAGGGSGITTHTINGAINVNGGALNLISTSTASVVINASGPVNINNGATLSGTGTINVSGSNTISFGPNATFAPGNGAGFGILNITTGSGNVATTTQTTNPINLTAGTPTATTAPSLTAGLGYGLGISPTNVVGSNFKLWVGTPVTNGAIDSGLSNSNTLGSGASGFAISSSGGGVFTLDPITTVSIVDKNGLGDFAAGGSYSFLVGTAPAGSSGAVTNLANFTGSGITFTAPSLQVSGTSVYLNFTTATLPTFTWIGLTSNAWATGSNWTGGATPVSGNTAIFNNSGNGNTTINLGGSVRPIGGITFDTAAAAAYTIGSTTGDALKFDAGGTVTVTSTVTTAQTINAAIQTQGALNITNNGTGGLTLRGALTLGGGSAGLLTFSGSGTTTYSGNISTGISGILQSGSGTVFLSGTNSFSGNTRITNGTLNINSDSALGAAAGIVLLTGGTLQFAAGGGVTLNSSRIIVPTGGAFDTNGGNDTINGVISVATSANGNLIKNGAGDLALTNINTYAGSTIVNAGSLVVGSTGSLSGGPLLINNTNPAPSSTDLYLYNTAGQTVNGLSSNLSGASSGNTVGIFLGAGVTLSVNQTAPGTFQGTISGGGNLALSNSSTSTLMLTGNNTYGGSTSINGGTIQLGVANALPPTTSLTLGSGGTLNLNSNNQTIAALNSSAGNINTGTGTGGILTIGNTAGGTVTYGGVISGTGGLTWGVDNTNVANPTPSTLLLTNMSTNTGPMTINSGTLSIGTAYALSGGVAPVLPYSVSATYPGAFTLGPTATLLTNGFNLTVGSLGGGGPIGGNINLGNNSSSTLYIVQSSSTGYAGVISGTGNVYIVNGVNLAVYGNWTLTGGVTHDVTTLGANHNDSPQSYLPFATSGSLVATQGIDFAGFTDQVSTIYGGSAGDNNGKGTFVDATGDAGKLVLSYYAATVANGGPANGSGGTQNFSGFFANDVGLIFDAGYFGNAQQLTLSGPNNTTGPLTIGFTNQTTPQNGAATGAQSGVMNQIIISATSTFGAVTVGNLAVSNLVNNLTVQPTGNLTAASVTIGDAFPGSTGNNSVTVGGTLTAGSVSIGNTSLYGTNVLTILSTGTVKASGAITIGNDFATVTGTLGTLNVNGTLGTTSTPVSSLSVQGGGVVAGYGTITTTNPINVTNGTIRGGFDDGINQLGTLSIAASSGTTAKAVLTIQGSGSSGLGQTGALMTEVLATSSTAATNSKINITGANNALNLNTTSGGGSGQINIVLYDPTASLTPGGPGGATYTFVLATVATAGRIQLGGTNQPASTLLDNGTTLGAGSGTMGNADLYIVGASQTYMNSVTTWSLSIDTTGKQLMLSVTSATPEPEHILLMCVGVLLAGFAIRRRWQQQGTRAPVAGDN